MSAETTVNRLMGEDKVTLVEAARLVGVGVHPTTVTRWCRKGVRLATGAVVRLEYLRAGAKFITTKQALARFLAAQTEIPEAAGPVVRSPAERRRAAVDAGRELEALGI